VRRGIVLIANDQEWTGRSLESLLSAEGYHVLRVYTGRQALDTAATHEIDAFILDLTMPDLDGLQVCRSLRADPAIGPAPPIFITTAGLAGRKERLNAYRAGAWEFFGQPFDADAVVLTLANYLAGKAAADRFREESLVDYRTGLYNRRGLVFRGRELASQARRQGLAFTAVVFAVEAPVNLFPAPERERLVNRAGEVFRTAGRAADAIGRLDGLEFGLLTIATGVEQTERLIKRLSDIAMRQREDVTDPLTVVLRGGYSVVENPETQPIDPERMLEAAQEAVRGLTTRAVPKAVGL
jgi:CheY-like chemotaxis protein